MTTKDSSKEIDFRDELAEICEQFAVAWKRGDQPNVAEIVADREEPVAVALQNLDRTPEGFRAVDQPVWLSWSEDAVVLLPPE